MSTIGRERDRWGRSVQNALNRDFCPWANKWVYWLKNPLWCLVLAWGAAVLCGALLNHNMFSLVGALTVVIGLGIAYPWLSLRGLHCQVRFTKPRIREGESVEVMLHVTNRWPWPVCGISLIRGFVAAKSCEPAVALAKVGAWSTCDFRWNFCPPARGIYPTQPPEVETSFPFGLFRAAKAVVCRSELIVWPRTVELNALPESEASRISEHRFTDRRAGEFGDLLGTRPFREGDSLRRVHWAQTARQGGLIVSERQASMLTNISVSVDLNVGQQDDDEFHDQCVDQVVRVAASICESMHRQHAHIDCRLDGEVYRCGANAAELRRLLDAFAAVPKSRTRIESSNLRPPANRGVDGALEIVVTTDQGFATQASRRDVASSLRYVVVETGGREAKRVGFTPRWQYNDQPECIASMNPWLEVAHSVSLERDLPRLWRKACHEK